MSNEMYGALRRGIQTQSDKHENENLTFLLFPMVS